MTPRVLIEPARLAGSSVLRCQTDDRLVDLVRAGNDRAFEAIVDRYRRPLVRYCGRLLPPARAEDAVQQAFMNAFAALRRNDNHLDLRPWLYRIAHNAALNALRESGWAHDALEAAALRGAAESAHDAAERRADLRTVLAAVQGLPDRQRDAIVLRELEGRTYEQIGVELDTSGGAVRQLLNRARNTLRAGVSALTPAGLLARLPWSQGGPVLDRMSEAASHEGVRSGAARLGGALVASVAVAAGLAEAPGHLPRLSHRPPAPPAVAAPPGDAPRLATRAPGADSYAGRLRVVVALSPSARHRHGDAGPPSLVNRSVPGAGPVAAMTPRAMPAAPVPVPVPVAVAPVPAPPVAEPTPARDPADSRRGRRRGRRDAPSASTGGDDRSLPRGRRRESDQGGAGAAQGDPGGHGDGGGSHQAGGDAGDGGAGRQTQTAATGDQRGSAGSGDDGAGHGDSGAGHDGGDGGD
ncbi:MAG: hypothetical protein QOE65_3052 [Solirubrobacteraceae bacterium]|jgi:RNA polymerase sigma factor (sigma-70 family)|nr:hypothetical protein [Solirubrobacteraceae bacterium]